MAGPALNRLAAGALPGVVLGHAALESVRRHIGAEWFGSPPHLMLLSGAKAEGLSAHPRDLRPVDPARGSQVLQGAFELAGTALRVGPGGDPFDKASPSRRFAVALHRFDWLPDLLAAGDAGARHALRLIGDWRRVFGRWNTFSWSAEVLERRVFNLACAARPLAAQASEAEAAALVRDLARQARHLTMIREDPARTAERAAVAGIAGCALAGPAGERLIVRSLSRLKRLLPQVVLADGGHLTRSPQVGLELLFDLMTLDEALLQRGMVRPDGIGQAIDRLTGAARFFTLADGRFAAFQGGAAVESAYIAAALAHDEDGRRTMNAMPLTGYHRLEGGGVQVMVDAAAPARGLWSTAACAQPLAVEVVAGGERLITSCGWSPEANGPNAVRLTDGASTVSLGDLSCGAPLRGIRAGALGARLVQAPTSVEARRHDTAQGVWVEATHDGWLRRFGLFHDRRLFLDPATGDLRGEDSFRPLKPGEEDGPRRYAPFTVRFHLHPDATASLANDRKSVLLKGQGKQGWWLRNDAVEVVVEPSVHFEKGQPRRTSQVVLRGQVRLDKGGRVRWKLSRAES